MFSPQATITRIRKQLQRLRDAARVPEGELLRTVPAVSGWSPAEHLDHLGKVTKSILLRLTAPERVDRPLSMMGRVILTLGWIPRGRGTAPERLRGTRVSGSELLNVFDELETLVEKIDCASLARSRDAVVPHPRFGGLTGAQALRFAAIHIEHHVKIIDEIVRTV